MNGFVIVFDGSIQGLAFHWVTGNLYGTTLVGSVFVCGDTKSSSGGLLTCITLMGRIGINEQIPVNPLQGEVPFFSSPRHGVSHLGFRRNKYILTFLQDDLLCGNKARRWV